MCVAEMVTTNHAQNNEKRPHQKDTRKFNDTCISRIYVNHYSDGRVTVTHITAHTNYEPGNMYLTLPNSTKK